MGQAAIIAVLFVVSAPLRAGAPGAPTFSRRVWHSADGLPEDFAQSIARTRDGYLWIGTSGGLVRFDGVRFSLFHLENVPAFRDDSIYTLFTARDGTLWAGTEGGGLVRYRGGEFRVYGDADGLSNGFVRVVYEDRQRNLWVGTDRGLFRMQGGRLVRVDGQGGIPPLSIHTIREDRDGRLLFGGRGLLVLDRGRTRYYRSAGTLADNSIRTILAASDGTTWIGTISGLRRIEAGIRSNPFETPRLIDGENISVLLEGRGGEIWIGTYGKGAMVVRNGRITRLTAPEELPNDNVLALFDDGEGDIWIGTQGGLLRLSPSVATTIETADAGPQSINTLYQDPRGTLYVAALNGRLYRASARALTPVRLPEELASLPIRNVFRDSSGALWLGTDGQGIVRWTEGGATRYTMKHGLINDFTRAFCEDRDGSIWIGTDGGLSRWRDGRFSSYHTKDGLAYGSIRALLADRSGNLWVATDGGLSRLRDGRFERDKVLDRLRGEKIWAVYEDDGGGLWIGTHGAGLLLLRNGVLRQFTTRHGLPSNKIYFLAGDAQGNLWMSGPNGAVSLSRRELEQLREGSNVQLAVRVYGTAEGLATNQMNGGVQPAGALTPEGELWLPSTKGAVRIDPRMKPGGDRPPPVLIEQVLADDQPVGLDDVVRLGPGRGKLEVQYTAVRLRSAERIRFKYLLEGFDPAWTEAGQRRVAYYTNVPPGQYRFRVVAYEINAPHRATERAVWIHWRPPFYETSWFLALCGLAAASLAWGGYRLHVRGMRQRFAAVLDERNRLAREMHDTLIQGCVGVSTLLEAASHARDVSPQISHELVDRAREEVRSAVEEARLAVWNLRHESGGGNNLVRAAGRLVERISREAGLAIGFEVSGAPASLSDEAERSLLMSIREALYNAVRHAAPTRLAVKLSFERSRVRVEIRDDGRGFDPAVCEAPDSEHYGIIGMRERVEKLGGRFDLSSSPGRGTQVQLTIPAGK